MPGDPKTPTRKQLNARPRPPRSISLAGPLPQSAPNTPSGRHTPHYEEGYREKNPWVAEWEKNAGSQFSLAGTFPHKVRFQGRRQRGKQQPEAVPEEAEKGETEVDTQVQAAQNQRHEGERDSDAQTQVEEEDYKFPATHTPLSDDTEYKPSLQKSPFKRRMEAFKMNNTPISTIGDDVAVPPEHRPYNFWAKLRLRFHRPLAEWLGMTIFIFLGCCGNMSVVTSDQQAGSMQSAYWSWGFAIMLGIYVAGGGSGGFLNPGLVIMLSAFRGFPAKRIPPYIFVQVLGAFVGALLAFSIYRDNILHMDGAFKPDSTGIYFYTQPKEWISPSTAFFTEFLGSAVIGCTILALGDSGNSPPGAGMHAFIIGLMVMTVFMVTSYITGAALNGARDLGPRLALLAVGYPTELFTAYHNWWIWGPWLASIFGTLTGGFLYDLCIFRGNESPVNFSTNKYKVEARKVERGWLHFLRADRKKEEVERKIEEGMGTMGTYESK
jgi:aquaglyceroporin related protein, other eukaryote